MTDIKITGQPDIPWIPDDYLKSDWYKILEDIDKHIFEKPKDKTDNDWFQSMVLQDCFSGIHDNRYLENLVTYWVNKRDEIVKKMEKGNWSSKSLTGIKMCSDIVKYDRACLIAIKKFSKAFSKLPKFISDNPRLLYASGKVLLTSIAFKKEFLPFFQLLLSNFLP